MESQPGSETNTGAEATLPLIIGTYTGEVDSPEVSASGGLYTLSFNGTGFGSPTLVAPVANPSFAVVDADNNRLYAVSETETGQLLAYQRNGQGEYNLINSVPSKGAYPCYLALSPDGSQLAVANYGTGNFAVYDVDPATGALIGPPQLRQHSGTGGNPERQEGPHAHWVQWTPDGEFLYVVDLGIDRVMGYAVAENGEFGDGFTAIETAPGSGPRHMVFHPYQKLAYIVTELDNKVVVARRQDDGRMVGLQTVSTLPEDFSGQSQAAHIAIAPNGKHLYISNRGHDSIAVFGIANDGFLKLVQLVGTQGDWPRYFVLLPSRNALLVANQNSHTLVPFSIDQNGLLTPNGESLQLAQPVFIAPLAAPGDATH